jgi:hypothetical protein
MAAVLEQQTEGSEQLQLYALQQMLRALCEHVARLVENANSCESLGTREADFQRQAFDERRGKALRHLNTEHREPIWMQIGDLERLIEAVDCSREFFVAKAPAINRTELSADWSVLVR